jgi:CRISPR-associated exonuclease Cas4
VPYTEDDLLPISALQHLAFCERQAALIHLEGEWQENRLTVEGHGLHEKVHEDDTERKGDTLIMRGLRVRSLTLGLVGAIDLLELRPLAGENTGGMVLAGQSGRYQPYIVEYKRGHPKTDHCDEIQLCAQAMCLEEMTGAHLAESAFFYGQPRRRLDVVLSPELRGETTTLAARLHELMTGDIMPPPEFAPRCHGCSLIEACLPQMPRKPDSVHAYIKRQIAEVAREEAA